MKLLSHQLDAYNDTTTKFVAMCGGFRSGKTVTGAYVTARNALLNAPYGVNGAILGQSAKQVENVLVKRFIDVLKEWGFERILKDDEQPINRPAYRFNNKSGSIDVYNGLRNDGSGLPAVSQVFIFTERSLLDNGLGYELGYFWIDELDTFESGNAERIWEIFTSRFSPSKYGVLQGIATSTPEGFQFMHSYFEEKAPVRHKFLESAGYKPDSRIINASMLDNPYLPADYVQSQLATLPKNKHAAYIYGKFANIVGLEVYCNFNRFDNNTDINAHTYKDATLMVGMDFNIGHMAAIVHIVYKGSPIAVEEIIDHNGLGVRDTPSMINILKQKYPNRKIIVYPDPASVQRNANGGPTTLAQLVDAFGKDGVNVMTVHPQVMDRVNSMNAVFSGYKNIRYMVNGSTCPQYVKSLERQVYDKNGDPSKANNVDHPLDAAGYFIYYHWPQQGKPKVRIL